MSRLTNHILSGAVVTLLLLCAHNASAEKIWNWRYTSGSVVARGTLTTAETADAQGFYPILSIAGHRNGERITGLHPTGKSIPGNEPFTLDNLIRIDAQGQITPHGFGFATASGGYANTFYAEFLATPVYMEVFVTPANYSELPIQFSATPVTEPEIQLDAPIGGSGKMDD